MDDYNADDAAKAGTSDRISSDVNAGEASGIEKPAAADQTIESTAPQPGRKRWVLAAAGAVGVALFAVPLLRGPNPHPRDAGSTASSIPAGAKTCSVNNGGANLDFTLKDMNGVDVQLSQYKGSVVLLNFWATWCGPCKLEIPEFVEVYNQYRDRGFVILGVLSEDDPSKEDLHAFTSEFKMNYPIFRAHEGLETSFGSLWALPTTFIIDRHGSICLKHLGPVSKEMVEQEIKGLL
jgi:peroxiredoxin